jgi:histone acetyltransferase (RNA polymerase elongator complex component)
MKKPPAYVIPFFISMQGCRYRCIYCNQHLLKGQEQRQESVADVVSRYLKCFKDKERGEEIAFYGGTFLALPRGRMDDLLHEADNLREEGVISRVRISTTPDSVNEHSCELVRDKVETVELGVQSLDNFILKTLKRDYDTKKVKEATECLRSYRFNVGHQLMLGLPFETFNSFAATVNETVILRPDFVRLYPLIIFKNTQLEAYYKLGLFVPCGLNDLIKRGAYALFRFKQAGIDVIRVGLTGFVDKADVSFDYAMDDYKGVMQSFLWREFIKQMINQGQVARVPKAVSRVTVECSAADYQAVVGHKKENLEYFKNIGVELQVTRGELQAGEILVDGKKYDLSNLDWSAL